MTLSRFRSRNHPQQTARRAPAQATALFDLPDLASAITDDVDDRGTDPELFAELDRRFHFTLDVAASHANAKCERYLTKDDAPLDGLGQTWAGERVWCNPPYSNIRPWLEKAWCIPRQEAAELIVMLLPANRTEQGWWQELVEPFRDRDSWLADPHRLRTEFLLGRRRFVMPGNTRIEPNERPPFGCVLLIWAPPES